MKWGKFFRQADGGVLAFSVIPTEPSQTATHGISNFRPLSHEKVKPCLGVDHTKESLSFA